LAAAPAPAFAAEVDALNDAQPDLNKRCSSRRIREEFGLNLRYATIAAGLPQALSASSAR
jgi:hypothetical protein